MNHQPNSIWSLPTLTPTSDGLGRAAHDIEEWKALTTRIATLATSNNWSKAEVARRSGAPEGTLSQWFSGQYKGRLDTTNARMRQWLDSVEEMDAMTRGIPDSPPFVETRTSREVFETLVYAQMMPEMVVVTLGAGMGKSITCKHYCSVRPHAFHCTMSPNTKTVHSMLVELSTALGVTQHNPSKLHRAIGERLQRNGRKTLLIIDEAQNLVDAAIDQLRMLLDINECGIALVGNEEIYDRFKNRPNGPSYAQIKRRIGKRLKRMQPYAEDIRVLIDAWGIPAEDEGSRRLLTGIGNKPGALGQIDKTMKLAGLLAAGDGAAISEKHIRAAWTNRSVED
jgi:DNA transposition AAA+ family ATPase